MCSRVSKEKKRRGPQGANTSSTLLHTKPGEGRRVKVRWQDVLHQGAQHPECLLFRHEDEEEARNVVQRLAIAVPRGDIEQHHQATPQGKGTQRIKKREKERARTPWLESASKRREGHAAGRGGRFPLAETARGRERCGQGPAAQPPKVGGSGGEGGGGGRDQARGYHLDVAIKGLLGPLVQVK